MRELYEFLKGWSIGIYNDQFCWFGPEAFPKPLTPEELQRYSNLLFHTMTLEGVAVMGNL